MFSRGRRPGSTPHFRFQCVALRHASGFAVRSRKTWTKAIAHLLRENASENGKLVERLERPAKYEAMLALLLDCKITVRTFLIAVGLVAAFPSDGPWRNLASDPARQKDRRSRAPDGDLVGRDRGDTGGVDPRVA